MALSISLSQTASATAQGPPERSPSEDRPTPQCEDPDATFVRGECITLECPTDDDIIERGDECIRITETPVDKEPVPTRPGRGPN